MTASFHKTSAGYLGPDPADPIDPGDKGMLPFETNIDVIPDSTTPRPSDGVPASFFSLFFFRYSRLIY